MLNKLKQNSKWLLITMIGLLLISIVIVAVVMISQKKTDFSFREYVDQYGEQTTYESKDPNISFDGVLEEKIWDDQRWLEVEHSTESAIKVRMTSYFGEDGLYMAFDVDDFGIYFDKNRANYTNSGVQLYLSSLSGKDSIDGCGYEITFTAGNKITISRYEKNGYKSFLGKAHVATQVKGELNTAEATGYTMEAFIDYDFIGKEREAIYANVAIVRSMSETGTERQWYSFGTVDRGASWTRAGTWWLFDHNGLVAYDVTLHETTNGEIEGKPYVAHGDDYMLAITAKEGYYADNILINDEDASDEVLYQKGRTYCLLECVEESLDIKVTFKKLPVKKMDIWGMITDDKNPVSGVKAWVVINGYSQELNVDANGCYSATVPCIEGMKIYAEANGYVASILTAKEGANNLTMQKMYLGDNSSVNRTSSDISAWDLRRLYEGRVRMKSTGYSLQLLNSEIYSNSIYASANVITDAESGIDTRTGFTFYVDKKTKVYVALTMSGEVNEWNKDGKVSPSIQLITEQEGVNTWKKSGTTVAFENPEEIIKLATSEAGIPMSVHYCNGSFDVWVNGEQIGYGIYPVDEEGNKILKTDTKMAVGLECWSSRAIYEKLAFDGNYPKRVGISAPGWDLSQVDKGIAKSLKDKGLSYAWLATDLANEISISANVPLKSEEGKDARAGFFFKNKKGDDVFVALTMNGEAKGEAFYSVQVISKGYTSWKKEGAVTDIKKWDEVKTLANSGEGVPMTVYVKNGRFTIGINGYEVAKNVYAVDKEGKNIFGNDTAVEVGLGTANTTATFTNLKIGKEKPVLVDASRYGWDMSQYDKGIAKSLTDSGLTYTWLTTSYKSKLCLSANISLASQEDKDTRAGFSFKNKKGEDVYVFLTMNGEAEGDAFYSIQIISKGYTSWKKVGNVTDITSWNTVKAAANSNTGVPMTVYVKDGKFTIGINGYLVAENVFAADAKGNNVFGSNTAVLCGLASANAKTTFTNVTTDTKKPALTSASLYGWDLSKLKQGEVSVSDKRNLTQVTLWEDYKKSYYLSSDIVLPPVGEDVRAGYCFTDADGNSIFVCLLNQENGKYSVQVISAASNGERKWLWSSKNLGKICETDKASNAGLPFGVAYDDGKISIWVNDEPIAINIKSFESGTKVKAGLECWRILGKYYNLEAYDTHKNNTSIGNYDAN